MSKHELQINNEMDYIRLIEQVGETLQRGRSRLFYHLILSWLKRIGK